MWIISPGLASGSISRMSYSTLSLTSFLRASTEGEEKGGEKGEEKGEEKREEKGFELLR